MKSDPTVFSCFSWIFFKICSVVFMCLKWQQIMFILWCICYPFPYAYIGVPFLLLKKMIQSFNLCRNKMNAVHFAWRITLSSKIFVYLFVFESQFLELIWKRGLPFEKMSQSCNFETTSLIKFTSMCYSLENSIHANKQNIKLTTEFTWQCVSLFYDSLTNWISLHKLHNRVPNDCDNSSSNNNKNSSSKSSSISINFPNLHFLNKSNWN